MTCNDRKLAEATSPIVRLARMIPELERDNRLRDLRAVLTLIKENATKAVYRSNDLIYEETKLPDGYR